MVLVQALCIVHATIQVGGKIHGDADDCLQGDKDVRDQTKDGVGRHKVGAAMVELVVLDNDETSDQDQGRGVVKGGVPVGADSLLVFSSGGLDDEDCLYEEHYGGRVEELERSV